ncbi:MAG TPA: GAF domain-containing SpoIIE family protein phosphatase [Terriglobia bacterium]|nr:GAF domain-containing SpoIIE family protein phosphatase [Terriglobia bacterium]
MRSIARLQRLLEASKLLNSTLDLAELTAIILRIVRDEVGTDRGTVFVLERARKMLHSLVAQGLEGQALAVPIGKGIAGTVAATGETIDIPNAYADSRFDSSFDATLGYRTNDIFCMPIVNRVGEIVGVLELMNRTRPLTVEDEEFLAGVSVHVGLALENAQLHREIIEKRRIEQELQLAREIQQNFYPNIPASYGGVQICASSEMCEAVGGDYVGYFPFDDGRFLVMLGDVSGKGIGAALVMSSLHAACRALVRHVHAIEDVTNILNETFVETTGAGTFVTMLIMLVDPIGRRVHFIRAGHNPPLSITGSGATILFDSGGGPPVGLFAKIRYRREISNVEPGSVLVVYTDGVSEAEDAKGDQLGLDRLASLVASVRLRSAAQIHEAIRADLETFVGDAPVHDDSTLIVLKFP